MGDKDLLESKRILIVDDEPDVLETLRELLSAANVVPASNFESAKKHLEESDFDAAVLDIMGVNGYELLSLCSRKNIPALMLTSHALTPENIMKSFKLGAASFIPKDKIADTPLFVRDVLEAKEKGKPLWAHWAARISESYWERKFGPKWKEKEKKFWKEFGTW